MKVAVGVKTGLARDENGGGMEVHVVDAKPETSVKELKELVAARLTGASREALLAGGRDGPGEATLLVYGEELCLDDRTMADFGLGKQFIRLVRRTRRGRRKSLQLLKEKHKHWFQVPVTSAARTLLNLTSRTRTNNGHRSWSVARNRPHRNASFANRCSVIQVSGFKMYSINEPGLTLKQYVDGRLVDVPVPA